MSSEPNEIVFNRPAILGRGLDYIRRTVSTARTAGDGEFTRKCSELLKHELGVADALLTTSCTDALELAAILLNIGPGDEVIVPSFSFVSTANAFALRGAKPVFADIRRDTLNLDESLVEALITPRTKAIVPVHYAGVACEMDALMELAGSRGVAIVEDNAHGLFARYRDRPLGTFGGLAAQSFHETKNFNCGEGGALLINDPAFIERAEIVRDKGTDRRKFYRGEIDKYSWVDLGSSFLLSDILAAFLYAQLEEHERVTANRKSTWQFYDATFRGVLENHGVSLPFVPEHCEHPSHIYYLILPSLERRQALIAHLDQRGINALFHYSPLHKSKMGLEFGGERASCPVTERVSDCLLRLPLYYGFRESDLHRVAEGVLSFFDVTRRRRR